MNKTVSIIVPVYKVECYLTACISSICNQTYRELEILLVDDGSPDNCPAICDEFAAKDPRIRVIHKENGGLSDARNAGLEIATGDYIGFIDSDDTIESDMVERLVTLLEEHDADVSCCRYTRVWEDGREERIGEDHHLTVLTGQDALKEFLLAKMMDPFVCNKLYKASLLAPHRFIKGAIGEDIPFNVSVFSECPRVVSVGESKYRYLQQRPGAITNSGVSQKRIDSVFYWNHVRQTCEQLFPELTIYALRRQALFYIGLYNRIGNDRRYRDERDTVRRFLKDHRKTIVNSSICEKVLKLSTTLIVKAPRLYHLAMKLYKKVIGEATL